MDKHFRFVDQKEPRSLTLSLLSNAQEIKTENMLVEHNLPPQDLSIAAFPNSLRTSLTIYRIINYVKVSMRDISG